jgi:hypothetical protein
MAGGRRGVRAVAARAAARLAHRGRRPAEVGAREHGVGVAVELQEGRLAARVLRPGDHAVVVGVVLLEQQVPERLRFVGLGGGGRAGCRQEERDQRGRQPKRCGHGVLLGGVGRPAAEDDAATLRKP